MSAISVAYKLLVLILFPSVFFFNTFLLGASLRARLSDDKNVREKAK